MSLGILIYRYNTNENFRNNIDYNLFNKSLNNMETSSIDLNTDKSNQSYVYSKYVCVLNDKKLKLYNDYGEDVSDIDVNINTAIFNSAGKYLAIAENKGNEVCLILEKTYLWSSTLDSEISQIYVNQNGYVAVVTSDSTHKAILTVFNSSGKQLFKSYFSSTRIVDASISDDNKYIAIGELDTEGTMIQSNIKIISIDNAQNDPDNAIIYAYNAESNKMIISVKYQGNKIACMYDNSLDLIENKENTEILNMSQNKNITLMSVDFNNSIAYIEDEANSVFNTHSTLKIENTETKQESVYNLESVAKDIYLRDNVIAINAGSELYFINEKGRLIKKYTSNQEIGNVLFSKSLAAVVYKDKLVLVRL